MHIIAVVNQKGGVGKTTSCVNLAAYLAKSKKKVLLVDLDPQGNATSGLGVDKQELGAHVYHWLRDKRYLEQALVSTDYGVDVLPTNQDLANIEFELANTTEQNTALKSSLEGLEYDFVLIDCPPSLGVLTYNALTAADQVLIPVQSEYYALEGLGQLLSIVRIIREKLNPDLSLLGVLMTMADSRMKLTNDVAEQVHKHFPGKVFKTVIPRNVRLAEAPSYGQPISEYDKWSKGAKHYKKLTQEIMKRLSDDKAG